MLNYRLCETGSKIFAQITLTLANQANRHAGSSSLDSMCDYVMSNSSQQSNTAEPDRAEQAEL